MATASLRAENYKDFFNGRPPKEFIYEDNQCVAFNEEDRPQAPIHFLVVPKKVIPRLADASPDDEKILGRLLTVARRLAKEKGLNEKGFRVVMNDGAHGGQTVQRFYVQVFGGRQMGHLLLVARDIAFSKGLTGNGYHVIVDEDFRVPRLKSLHVFGRALHHMIWSVGPGSRL